MYVFHCTGGDIDLARCITKHCYEAQMVHDDLVKLGLIPSAVSKAMNALERMMPRLKQHVATRDESMTYLQALRESFSKGFPRVNPVPEHAGYVTPVASSDGNCNAWYRISKHSLGLISDYNLCVRGITYSRGAVVTVIEPAPCKRGDCSHDDFEPVRKRQCKQLSVASLDSKEEELQIPTETQSVSPPQELREEVRAAMEAMPSKCTGTHRIKSKCRKKDPKYVLFKAASDGCLACVRSLLEDSDSATRVDPFSRSETNGYTVKEFAEYALEKHVPGAENVCAYLKSKWPQL